MSIAEGTLWNWVRSKRDAAERDADPNALSQSERDGRIFRPRDDAVIRFRFVHDHLGDFDVKRMCRLVEVPRSSFYEWLNRKPWARDIADAELLDVVHDIYNRFRGSYGVPRVYGQLRR